MQFIFDVVVISFSAILWFGILSSIYDWAQRKLKVNETNATAIGLSSLTLRKMHEDRKSREGDLVTSEWAPVRLERKDKVQAQCFSIFMIILGGYGVFSFSAEAVDAVKYQLHVSKICEHTTGYTKGYDHGVWSNHPRLVRVMGKNVPLVERVANGKKLCGHD